MTEKDLYVTGRGEETVDEGSIIRLGSYLSVMEILWMVLTADSVSVFNESRMEFYLPSVS